MVAYEFIPIGPKKALPLTGEKLMNINKVRVSADLMYKAKKQRKKK